MTTFTIDILRAEGTTATNISAGRASAFSNAVKKQFHAEMRGNCPLADGKDKDFHGSATVRGDDTALRALFTNADEVKAQLVKAGWPAASIADVSFANETLTVHIT